MSSLLLVLPVLLALGCASAVTPEWPDGAPAPDVRATDAAPEPTARPVAPLSTSRVTSQQPTLHWALGDGADGAHVDLCRDRALTQDCRAFDANGASGRPSAALDSGMWFWRVRARAGSTTVANPGPVWEFLVPHASTSVDTSWGTTLDANGDGLADVAAALAENATDSAHVDVYLGTPSGLAAMPVTLHAPDGTTSTEFGAALGCAGDVNGDGFGDLVVGAPYGDLGYVFLGGPDGLGTMPAVTLPNPTHSHAAFGANAIGAGDLDGDGYGDIVLSALEPSPDPQPPRAFTADAFVYFGSANGPPAHPRVTLHLDPTAGVRLANAGDTNGDGFADLGMSDVTGEVAIFLGSAHGPSARPSLSIQNPFAENASFGWSMAGTGDFDNDGFADLAVGNGNQSTSPGNVFVYHGGASGLDVHPAQRFDARFSFAYFGASVSSAGDLNGDGFDDLAIGASQPPTETAWTTFYVYLGGTAGLVDSGLGDLGVGVGEWADNAGYFDSWMVIPGDVDGDERADLIAWSERDRLDPMTRQFEASDVEFDLFTGARAGVATPASRLLRYTLSARQLTDYLPTVAVR